MKGVVVSAIIVLLSAPAFADAFMKLFMERQAMIEVFSFNHSNDCVGFDETDLHGSLAACNAALKETVAAINAGNRNAQAQLFGVLAMEYLARSKVLDQLGRYVDARSDCDRAVKYARMIKDREKLAFFEEQCR